MTDPGAKLADPTDTDATREALRRLCRRWPDLAARSHHEAGHVLACRCFNRPIAAVTLVDDQRGGATLTWPNGQHASSLREDLVILASGGIASRIYDPTADPGDADDATRALEKAWSIVGRAASKHRVDHELDTARRRAARVIREHWSTVESVALSLLRHHEVVEAVVPLADLTALD